MKLTFNTDELKGAVQVVIPALSVKSENTSAKVYEFIQISTCEGAAILRCCNMKMQIETRIPAVIDEEGDLLLPGRLFSEIVARLPGNETSLESTDSTTAAIKSGAMNMKLQTLPSDEFEGLSSVSSESIIRLEEGTLKKMILQTAPFALQDNTRPILKGILVEVENGKLTMVAMEPLKFGMRKTDVEQLDCKAEIIVPSKLFESAARILDDSNDLVSLTFSSQSLTIATSNTTIILLKLDGTYIDYRSLMPQKYDTRVKLTRKDFIAVAERAYLVARDDMKNCVKLVFDNDKISVMVENEIGSVNDSLNAYISGSGLTMHFNIKNFLEVVKNIEDEEIIFELGRPKDPCVIKPVEGDSFFYIVLPIVVM